MVTSHLTKAKINGLILSCLGLTLLGLFHFIISPSEIFKSSAFYNYIQTSAPFTLTNFCLLLINIGLTIIVNSKEAYEDERTERIRNHCFKFSFRNAFAVLMLLGIAGISANLLIVVLFLLCYYCLLFRLCLYRDSALVYLNDDDQKRHFEKSSKEHIKIILVQSAVLGLIGGAITIYKPGEWLIPCILAGGFVGILWSFVLHWKSDAIKSE